MNNVDEYYNNHELRFIIHNKGYGKENYELRKRIDKAIEKIKEHKQDLDYEPWSIYQIEGKILFDLVDILKGSDSNE